MDTTNNNETFTQGAEVLNECELHEKIMQELNQIHTRTSACQRQNGYVYTYHVKALTDERALYIAQRGNVDEIKYLTSHI